MRTNLFGIKSRNDKYFDMLTHIPGTGYIIVPSSYEDNIIMMDEIDDIVMYLLDVKERILEGK